VKTIIVNVQIPYIGFQNLSKFSPKMLCLGQPCPKVAFWGFLAFGFETLNVNILGLNLVHAFLTSKSRPNFFLRSSAPLEPPVEIPEAKKRLPDFELLERVSELKFFREIPRLKI
jgi:hypothetical protein